MRSGERGNPDHPPTASNGTGRRLARGAEGCGEWDGARSEGRPV